MEEERERERARTSPNKTQPQAAEERTQDLARNREVAREHAVEQGRGDRSCHKAREEERRAHETGDVIGVAVWSLYAR